MSNITKERALQIFLGNGPEPTASEERELARIALASLEAEAVAYVDPFSFHNFSVYRAGETDNKRMGREWMWANPDAGLIPVYTAPPAPVSVPDEQHSERLNWTLGQWAEHVGGHYNGNDPANYYEFGSFMAVAAMLIQFGTVQQKLGWNACRAAMLQGVGGALTNEDTKRVDELVMWIKRLAHSLRKANPDSKLQSDAMDYLSRMANNIMSISQ